MPATPTFNPQQAHIRNKAGDVWQVLLADGSGWDEAATATAYNKGAGTPSFPKALPAQP